MNGKKLIVCSSRDFGNMIDNQDGIPCCLDPSRLWVQSPAWGLALSVFFLWPVDKVVTPPRPHGGCVSGGLQPP